MNITRIRRVLILSFVGGALSGGAAQAQLYQCKGEDGRVRFVSSAEQCSSAYKELPSYGKKKPETKSPAAAKPSSSASSAPRKFGKVPSRRQKELDKKRGDILLYELRSERAIEARLGELLVEAESETRRIALQKRLDEHRRNIAAIQRELARLGYAAAE